VLRRILPTAALLCATLASPTFAADFAWKGAGSLAAPRIGAASAVLKDGRVLLVGGRPLPTGKDSAVVDVYDPATHSWADAPQLPEPRSGASAVTLRDGRVLVLGGSDDADQHRAELFDPGTGTWTPTADSIAPHVATPGFVLEDGRVFFFGGDYYWSTWRSGEIYDPQTGAWTLTAEPHELGSAAPTVVRLRDGRFLVAGRTSVWTGSASRAYDKPVAEIYDAIRDTWTRVTPPQSSRESAGGALLADGRVLIAGGHPGSTAERLFDATAHGNSEIFDPATATWSPTGDLQRPRGSGSTVVTLADGRVVALGGSWATITTNPVTGRRQFADIYYEATAEVYDVAAGVWRAIPPSPTARAGHAAEPLADGSMLVVGGVNGPEGAATAVADRLVPVPATAPGPPPTVVQPPAPKPLKAGTIRFVKPSKRLKPTRTGTLALTVSCSKGGAACTDRLVLRGRGRVLAQRDVSVAAGKTVSVRVKLSAAARRALRDRTTRVTVTLKRQGTKVNVSVRG
jgi:hypothetical protein